MAKRAEDAPRGNGFEPEKVQGYIDTIMRHIDDLDSERGTYMARCKPIRAAIAQVYTDAKDVDGIPKMELKAVVKKLGLDKKIAKIVEDMEADQAETYEMLLEAIGGLADTPLGEAALSRKKGRKGKGDGDAAHA